MEMIELILIPLFMLASYLHGGDYVSKGVLIAALVIASAALGFAVYGVWGLLFALASPFYWFTFRTGKQAKAELDYMYRLPDGDIRNIALAYAIPITVSIIPMIVGLNYLYIAGSLTGLFFVMLSAFIYRDDIGERSRDNRKMIEVANGFLGGVCSIGLFCSIIKMIVEINVVHKWS